MAKNLPIKFVMFGAMALLGLPVDAAPPATPDGAAGLRVNLAIDTSILDSGVAERLEPEITKQLGPVLEAGNLHVVSPPEVGEQMLSIRVKAYDEEQRNYQVDLQLGREGGVTTLVTVNCNACNERRLIAKVVEGAPKLVAIHEDNVVKDGDRNAALADPHPETPRPVPDVPKRLIGPLGGTGTGMMAVGVIALVTGSYLFADGLALEATDPEGIRSPDNLRFAGLGTFAGGLLVAGLGTTFLAIDLNRARKGVRRFAPQLTPTYVGIQFRGQF